MKKLFVICFLLIALQLRAQTISDVSDNGNIVLSTGNAGDIRSVLANYPGLAATLKTAVKAKLDAEDDLSAFRRWKDLQARNVSLPAAVVTALTTRFNNLRTQKEAALRTVATTDPQRAKQKMDELLALGVPITQATQDIVNAANPTPAPTATPAPTPDDGL